MIKFDLDRKNMDNFSGDPFIKRPAFVAGTMFKQVLQPTRPDFPVQARALDKDGRLRRKNFRLSGPVPRPAKTIQEIEALKTKQQGIKFRLGPGQFGKVRVAKRDAKGEVIKDEEGNIIYEMKEFNLSMATLPLQDRIELLQESLSTGIRGDLNNIGILLASILGSNEDVKNLTSSNLRVLQQVLRRDPEGAPLGEGKVEIVNPWDTQDFDDLPSKRFITRDMWNTNDANLKTRVRAFLLQGTSFASQLSPDTPVFGTTGNTIDFDAIGQQINIAKFGDRVLDLGTRRIFRNQEEADEEAGEAIELDVAEVSRSSAAVSAAEEEEKDDDDPTVASATELSQAVVLAQRDPSAPDTLQNLVSAIRQQSGRTTEIKDPFGQKITISTSSPISTVDTSKIPKADNGSFILKKDDPLDPRVFIGKPVGKTDAEIRKDKRARQIDDEGYSTGGVVRLATRGMIFNPNTVRKVAEREQKAGRMSSDIVNRSFYLQVDGQIKDSMGTQMGVIGGGE